MLIPLAQAADRTEITASDPEQVDLVAELAALARVIAAHNQRVMVGDPVEWNALADQLAATAGQCRGQVVIDQAGEVTGRGATASSR